MSGEFPGVRSEAVARRFNLLLAVGSGILLGASFPPSPFCSLAYIAFLPFFYLSDRLISYRQILWYSYVFLLVFHMITLYWAGGFTHARDAWMMTAGLALLTIHPMFYLPSILMSFFIRRRLGSVAGLVSFALLWISFEYSHALTEFSFPWVTIGNSQAYDIARAQLVEFTSVYGLSFLIFAFNIVAFVLITRLSSNWWQFKSMQSFVALTALLIIYFGPFAYGHLRLSDHQDEMSVPLRVGIVQPNFDPWDKWGQGAEARLESGKMQLETYIGETGKLAHSQPDLIVWPETAIPFPVLLPHYSSALSEIVRMVDSIKIPVFMGFDHVEFVDSAHAGVTAHRVLSTNTFYESYNSAIMVEPGGARSRVYKKMALVPFAERIPYAEALSFLIEPLKWNVGISSWGKGADTIVFTLRNGSAEGVRFSGMICYESVFPNFVREFVRKGAEFLVVMTNDSWWGKTSGAYQHAAYATFRAIENRRWVVQCANGGISEFVDPHGTVRVAMGLFTFARWVGTIEPRTEMTFYARYGDVFAQGCLFCSAVFVILALSKKSASRP